MAISRTKPRRYELTDARTIYEARRELISLSARYYELRDKGKFQEAEELKSIMKGKKKAFASRYGILLD